MKKYSNALSSISNRVSLFETDLEMDGFLKEAISQLMDQAGASLGAVFVYDENSRELVFRVGYDSGDYWDTLRCSKKKRPMRFSLDDNELGRAFRDDSVRIHSYEISDENPFRSKLLIPIVRGPEKLGVLMMAHPDAGIFKPEDKSDLKRAASLLGDMLVEATAFMFPPEEGASIPVPKSRIIKGLKASAGHAFGTALPIWSDIDSVADTIAYTGSQDTEMELFEKALELSSTQLERIEKSASFTDTEMISLIFTAQLYMLKDSSFLEKIRQDIRDGSPAAKAVKDVIQLYADRFASMTEARLAEKAQDVRDLGYRILSNMARPDKEGFTYNDQIVLSRHIYPSDLFRLAVEGVAGIVLRGAGVTAHISILARSLSIPVLITDDKSLLNIPEGLPLLLDATKGFLYVRPDEKIRKEILEQDEHHGQIPGSYILKGHLSDGNPVSVHANINILKDAEDAVQEGAEGIGLYRSEFPFILKNDFLSEEQQFRLYRSIVMSQKGKPVTLRTADIGGDKLLQGRSEAESNPFLGVRGIRFSLANLEMFHDQLRAMLRAGEGADLGIMFPMVSGVEELLQAREELDLCIGQLKERGEAFNSSPRIGAMVELPSAAMAVSELSEHSDFLSIGSNDLTMYLLAVDRTNENLSHLYRSHHPTVLKVLATIVEDAGDKRDQISVCGDIASDPFLIPVLVGMGIKKLSVAPSRIDAVKQRLLQFSLEDTQIIKNEILAIRRLDEMDRYMKSFQERWPLP
ncbi:MULTISPECIES: phosphoenolpyruvate--protein phosphotransferase [unclassified Oceanispirochaeta]|uniref:phosphoenolpyruvate--protein phosphotransferase n=1 Tax=unclassified Oceanispirochaeta TaxID=2635722 RepID=UPI0011C03661|nr:phosphoenolpyruvate--protein phosphotransferase [Oceanispirochaeta sp. M1]MBF9014166.1 phosphoenolpyruvate--protein phosphotransferase [Oceanispirochaeta sp. M2]NPD70656.1 phosphoenolpyruvate--protein phosphotransferase [Oceanispirochaeta sp. M1]